jgi:hypothetical protein
MQGGGMNRKPNKAAETAAPYPAAKPATKTPARNATEPGIRSADVSEVRQNNARLMRVHHKVLQKLAQ